MSEPDAAGLDRQIAERRARLDALRPLDPRSLQALDAWYDVELTWSSNAIEGNSLTRVETAIVIEKGITIGGKPLKDHLEAIDHIDALGFVRALAGSAERIRETDLREIHRLVLGRSAPGEAGRYSTHRRTILGSSLILPTPAEIPPLMADFAAWLSASDPEPEVAFEAHYRLVTIHPFSDGNGRTARLLMNLVLLKAGYPPVTIGPTERPRYIEALDRRQVLGDRMSYDPFMRQRLLETLDRMLAHLGDAG